ncbi:MAG: branched-chain amino acid ABC transporter substrate-binding protein [Gemmatimonadota bacterium]|nr:MAG: branched-chain amino acid ABC transporter substrate-binding protein [Gemmatimonadota bacterium]
MADSHRGSHVRRLAAAGSRILLASAGLSLGACGSSDDPILIGLAGPFSQPRAESMQLAAQLAVSEINEQGGVRGRPLQLVIQDDSGMAAAAVQVARVLYANRDVVAVVGHMNSGATLAAARVYNGGSNSLVAISPSASSPDLSSAGPYTFRVCPTDSAHGVQLAQWARAQIGANRVAILYENDAYGRGLRTTFKDSFTQQGGQIVSDDPVSAILPSFEPYLTRTRSRGGADAILFAGARAGAEEMIRTFGVIRYSTIVLGGDGIAGIETADVDAEGVYVSLAYLYDQPGALNQAFTTAYRRTYGGQVPDHRGAGAYDAIRLLARAIESVGANRARIRDYLAAVGDEEEPFDGVTGRIVFDDNGDVVDRTVVVGVVRDKRLESTIR